MQGNVVWELVQKDCELYWMSVCETQAELRSWSYYLVLTGI